MTTSRNVEILVHIAAPSKASDDVRYRSLAAAYVDFWPENFHNLSLAETYHDDTLVPATKTSGGRSSNHRVPSQRVDNFAASFSSLQSPQASFASVLDNAGSPLRYGYEKLQTPRGPTHANHFSGPQSSWKTPPSIVQDSVPDNDATTALLTTPTRVLEHYLQNFTTPSQISHHTSQQRGSSGCTTSPNQIIVHKSSGRTNEDHDFSTIPCTPGNKPSAVPSSVELGVSSFDAQDKQSEREAVSSSQVVGIDEDIIEDTVMFFEPQTPPVARADSEPPPSKRVQRDRSYASPGALFRTSSDIGTHWIPDGSRRTITFLPIHRYNSLELNSPEPPVSCATTTAEDLMTPGLEKLAADLNIGKRFRPEKSVRDLRPFERGYWTLDCTDWPQDIKSETWIFLANYVGTGLAGWGISCRRDARFTWLRVYCWGSLVGHIYLLIYLASRRRVCYGGATWFDGEGKSTIVMGKREGPWTRM